MAVFWDVAPCRLVYSNGQWAHCPDDGSNTDLWNVGKLIPVYMVLQPRRQPSSYSPLWEPQIIKWVYILDTKRMEIFRRISSWLSTDNRTCTTLSFKANHLTGSWVRFPVGVDFTYYQLILNHSQTKFLVVYCVATKHLSDYMYFFTLACSLKFILIAILGEYFI
jgi:hypothetical protein